ncbi:MAG: hypothetical protein LQ337_007297 [Flavoplaca oasis]|nr:MAG: hypothetical protein LQ337_007297 [Flavoplaca oasis]
MNIPTEISLRVLSYLSTKDIKRVRLVCQEMAWMGAEFLCRNLYISPFEENTRVFTAITHHPKISRSVRNIIYDSAHFDNLCLCGYLQALHQQLVWLTKRSPLAKPSMVILQSLLAEAGDSEGLHDLVRRTSLRSLTCQRPISLLEDFQQYSCMAREELNIDKKSWLHTIHKGLQFLRAVQTVTIANSWDMPCTVSEQVEAYYERNGNILRTMGSPLARSWPITTLMPQIRLAGEISSGSEFSEIIQLLQGINKRPLSFNGLTPLASTSFLHCPATHYFNSMIDKLVVLQLQLQIPIDESSDPMTNIPVLDLLTTALQNASSLKVLFLHLPQSKTEVQGQGPDYLFPYTSAHVLPPLTTWRPPNLQTLSLGALTFSYHDLVGLLFISLPHLQQLSLQGINLTDGYWADIAQGLQYLFELQGCSFQGSFCEMGSWFDVDESDMLDYCPMYPDPEAAKGWMERLNKVFYEQRTANRDYLSGYYPMSRLNLGDKVITDLGGRIQGWRAWCGC